MKKKVLIAARACLSFRSNHKPLSFEVRNSVGFSNVRGWSYAASVPDDTLNAQKRRKKVPKHERRAMVESFVNKYRAMNDGKFPKASDVKKQVGGSYYVVREIIQELEYKSKMNSSNSMDDNLLEKEEFDNSKLLITKAVKVSSGNTGTGTAIDGPIQDDSQLVVLDDKKTINTGYEHLEERWSQTSSLERRLSKEVDILSTPDNHCFASESNLLEKHSEEPYRPSFQKPNDVKTDEAVSSYSGSVAPERHLPQEEKEHVSTSSSENYGNVCGKVQGNESEFVDAENHQIMDEKCIEKAGYDRREAALEELSEEPSHSSLQVSNDVKTVEDVSSYSSDSVAPERHLLKEIEHVSASFIEKSGSSYMEALSHDSEFVNIENHPINEEKSFEKAGFERKKQDALEDLPGVDGPKHKMEPSQGPLKLDESETPKTDNSNNRETGDVLVSEKSTLWGNLKSLADGIINIWRKL